MYAKETVPIVTFQLQERQCTVFWMFFQQPAILIFIVPNHPSSYHPPNKKDPTNVESPTNNNLNL